MPKITAVRPLNHGTRLVAVGEELDVSETDAQYYVARKMGTYSTRMLTADASTPEPAPTMADRPLKRGPGRPRRDAPSWPPAAPMSTTSTPSLVQPAPATPPAEDDPVTRDGEL